MKKKIIRKKNNQKRLNLTFIADSLKGVIFSAAAFLSAMVFWLMSFFASESVLASGLSGSKFVTGTTKMLEDATNVLIILAPVVTIFMVGYFFIRKGAADEMDHKKWSSRITTAIVSCIGVVSASVIVKVVMAYYS